MSITLTAHRRRAALSEWEPAVLFCCRSCTRHWCSLSRRFPSSRSGSGGPPIPLRTLHTYAVLQTALAEPAVFDLSQRAYGVPAGPLARSPPAASPRRRASCALVAGCDGRVRRGLEPLAGTRGNCPGIFCDCLRARLRRRLGTVSSAGTFRTRTGYDQPLWVALQPVVLQ